MKPIKIPCSPEVRELNEAVETVDMLTNYAFDKVDGQQLVDLLQWQKLPWHAADLQEKIQAVEAIKHDYCPWINPMTLKNNK